MHSLTGDQLNKKIEEGYYGFPLKMQGYVWVKALFPGAARHGSAALPSPCTRLLLTALPNRVGGSGVNDCGPAKAGLIAARDTAQVKTQRPPGFSGFRGPCRLRLLQVSLTFGGSLPGFKIVRLQPKGTYHMIKYKMGWNKNDCHKEYAKPDRCNYKR